MGPLRILHVVPYYEHAWAYGGIARLATTMTRALARRGHDVAVCTTDACDDRSRTAQGRRRSHGVDVRTIPNISNRAAYHLQLFAPVGMRRHLRATAGDFDVAHLHACHNLPATIAAAALTRAGVPYVVSPNGTARPIERRILLKRVFAATAGRRLLTGATLVLAVTEVERAQLIDLGIPPSKIRIVPNPLDDRATPREPDPGGFRRKHQLGDARLVLFLGKLTPRKGIDDLILAFARLKLPGTVLVIAGNDMGAGAGADALVSRLGLRARVIRTGLLRDTDRDDALSAAAVVVYPSRDEIFGLVPLEALLCGTPVIVCGDSGCGEVIRRTGGGLVVPPGRPQDLEEAIGTILGDTAIWKAAARSAAVTARELFGADVVCDALELIYADVCHVPALERRHSA